ncbi:HK97-gp10 family putative phage morphogenesis protein [Pseudomonas alliivorans]|nr:HK97-gp10 family putative phage morphogenesis protein [Pseudomonas alliivorans]
MADSLDFQLEGIDSLVGKLESISYDMKRKGGRSALRKAAKVVADAAKQNAKGIDDPRSVEAIYKNIALRWNGRLFKSSGNLGFRVGVLGGARIPKSKPKGTDSGYPGGDTRYWAFVEFGTSKSRAQPFMRKALADNIAQATDTFLSEYEKAVDRAIKRAAKAAGAT